MTEQRIGQLYFDMFGCCVVNCEILLETLHLQRQSALFVDNARSTVIDYFARAAYLVYDNDVFRFDECYVVHGLVTLREHAFAVTTGVDADDRIDIAVNLADDLQIVADHDSHLFAGNFDALHTIATHDKAHLSTRRNVLFGYAADDSAILDNGCRTQRSARREYRQTDYGCHSVAMFGYAGKRLFAQF